MNYKPKLIVLAAIVGIFGIFVGSALTCVKAESPGTRTELAVVRDGRPQATIVISAKPSENARIAATELQAYLAKISGARLTIAADNAPPAGTLVLVGRSSLTDRMPGLTIPDGKTKNLREEGFVMQTAPERLVLAGNDVPPYFGTALRRRRVPPAARRALVHAGRNGRGRAEDGDGVDRSATRR